MQKIFYLDKLVAFIGYRISECLGVVYKIVSIQILIPNTVHRNFLSFIATILWTIIVL